MRIRPAGIAAILTAALLVAMALVHIAHSHDDGQPTTFHPACTVCQFHAPTATVGDVQAHGADPGVSSCVTAPDAEKQPAQTPRSTHASRAPPSLLAV